MANWTATTTTKATPDQVLQGAHATGGDPCWSPFDLDVDDLDSGAPGARHPRTVTGRLAGASVGFDVEVHAAYGSPLLELSADGPVGIEVGDELAPAEAGSEERGFVSTVAAEEHAAVRSRTPPPPCPRPASSMEPLAASPGPPSVSRSWPSPHK